MEVDEKREGVVEGEGAHVHQGAIIIIQSLSQMRANYKNIHLLHLF